MKYLVALLIAVFACSCSSRTPLKSEIPKPTCYAKSKSEFGFEAVCSGNPAIAEVSFEEALQSFASSNCSQHTINSRLFVPNDLVHGTIYRSSYLKAQVTCLVK